MFSLIYFIVFYSQLSYIKLMKQKPILNYIEFKLQKRKYQYHDTNEKSNLLKKYFKPKIKSNISESLITDISKININKETLSNDIDLLNRSIDSYYSSLYNINEQENINLYNEENLYCLDYFNINDLLQIDENNAYIENKKKRELKIKI